MSEPLSISACDWLKLIILSILWGMSFIFMEVAIEELGTFTIVAARVGIAALALNLFIAFQGRHVWSYRRHFKAFCFMAIIGNVIPFSLIVWGQIYVTASLAAILNATAPFFTLIIAHAFTQDEKMTAARIMALLIGFLGVVMIIGPDVVTGIAETNVLLGEMAILLAVACYGVVLVYGRKFGKINVPPLVVSAGQMIIATLVLLPLAVFFDGLHETTFVPSMNVIGALLGMGLLSTAMAFALWYHLLNRIGSNNTSLVTFLIPVSAISMGYLFLGEHLEWNQLLGVGLIATGLILVDKRLFSWVVSKNP